MGDPRMSRGGTQKSLRKALGAIKDTTTVSLAKVRSDYKELDIAIVKATNHHERPAKERHIRAIFAYISAVRPRADVAYCIHALARRLSRTHNWAVALKTLIVIHRTLREVDPTFHEELLNYGRRKIHMLNMTHFRDDSSQNAWDYSTWVRNYALFLEERLECLRVLKYDIQSERPRIKDLGVEELLEQLPALQQLLFRIMNCQPQGASIYNSVIHSALSMMASESTKIYQAISDGLKNLVDKFFQMQRSDASRALDIYKRARQQVERLSEFYEMCKNLDVSHGERFIKIEQLHTSFLQAMEEYVHESPRSVRMRTDQGSDNGISAPKEVLAIEYSKSTQCPPSEPVKTKAPVVLPDLLALDDPVPTVPEADEKHAISLAIVPIEKAPNISIIPDEQPGSAAAVQANGTIGWELTLLPSPSPNDNTSVPAAANKLAGGLDKLNLDSLYDDAIKRNHQQNSSHNQREPVSMYGNGMLQQLAHDPSFYATNMAAAAQMAAMSSNQQQQALMLQQQQMMMMMMGAQQQQSLSHFGTSYAAAGHSFGAAMPVPAYNPYAGMM